jgi:hypothetical protein
MSYQAVARDENGYELKNRQIDVKISILDQSFVNEYCESHSPITDKYGLFSLIIGEGSYVAGPADDFTEINWGSGVHYMSVDVDFGSGFKHMGTTQFLAVPYALYAGTASNSPGSKDDQKLSFDPLNKELTLEDGGKADLSGLYEDSDADPTNELQFLSWNGEILSIKSAKGDSSSVSLIELKNDQDHDITNELQEIHLDQEKNELTISNSPTNNPVYLNKYLDNTDEQTLSVKGDSLLISNGNAILTDVSKTNELQSPVLNANELGLTNDLTNTKVNLEKYLVHDQNLHIDGYKLTIDSGIINIRPDIFAFKALTEGYSVPLQIGIPSILKFPGEKLNMGNGYNKETGRFTVPIGGEGLYHFDLIYKSVPEHTVEIYVNGDFKEKVITVEYYPFVIYLKDNEYIEIVLKSTEISNSRQGIFSGYRIH